VSAEVVSVLQVNIILEIPEMVVMYQPVKPEMHTLLNQQTQRCRKTSCLDVFKSTNQLFDICHKISMNKPSLNEFYSYL
jgi:hypothetical protein